MVRCLQTCTLSITFTLDIRSTQTVDYHKHNLKAPQSGGHKNDNMWAYLPPKMSSACCPMLSRSRPVTDTQVNMKHSQSDGQMANNSQIYIIGVQTRLTHLETLCLLYNLNQLLFIEWIKILSFESVSLGCVYGLCEIVRI